MLRSQHQLSFSFNLLRVIPVGSFSWTEVPLSAWVYLLKIDVVVVVIAPHVCMTYRPTSTLTVAILILTTIYFTGSYLMVVCLLVWSLLVLIRSLNTCCYGVDSLCLCMLPLPHLHAESCRVSSLFRGGVHGHASQCIWFCLLCVI